MNKVFSKKSLVSLVAVALLASGFFMFAGTASAALTWSADAGAMNWNAGTAYCGALSTDKSIVWRLPSTNELSAAYTSGVPGSFADVYYWSGTTNPDSSATAYDVLMSSGYVDGSNKAAPDYHVRCVRSTADVVWQSGAGSIMDWNAGTAYCGGLSTDQAIVWRLPSTNELSAAYTSGVPGSFAGDFYWSGATTPGTDPVGVGAYKVRMSDGVVTWGDKTSYSSTYASCVRDVPTTYAITDGTMTRVSGDITSTVDIDATPVTAGATVTLTAAAKSGMQLQAGTLVASYNDGSPKTLTLSGSGPYTFTMPAYAVTVTATFEAIPVDITSFDAITDIAGGIVGSATYANAAAVISALPESATANSGSVTVPVTTWVDTDSYNPAVAGTYSFTATLGTIPEGFTNTGNHTATVDIVLTASEDELDRAKDISWKAEKYTDSNKSCSERLKLTINGHHFDKDAEVFIGSKEASSVSRRSSQKIVAKFCLEKLLNDKVDQKRKVTVKNPDTKESEANKQIDLGDLTSGNEVAVVNNTSVQTSSTGDYNQKTKEGAKQIQEALNKLGYLDAENITSTFGSITMEAVKKFQSDNGIDATGFVGELTKAKLAEKLK